ncbi:signal transduction histidine kinase [Filimonas zeae]|uniref:histidine kinase n=1 Tax=Filimonas zeae TaxID=1737353 RepID=A0A917IYE5_9BACT|nr:HAMP domain-containing sensor histidine kinase [Filimonas zeae]MDR6338592.1 signal transduction histidine kinase [Filimonas zeae]GGH67504.1 hypothetical protein GCM10011379_22850 [Filimonas zeae]
MQSPQSKSAKSLQALLAEYWRRLLFMGTTPDMPVRERQKTLVLNVLLIGALPFIVYFCCINFIDKYYLLGTLNAINALVFLILVWINYKQRFFWARIPLFGILAVVFLLQSVLFKNGAEYFLLMLILAAVIVFASKLTYFIFSTLVIVAFTWVRIYNTPVSAGMTLSQGRVAANLITASFFMVVTAQYFKNLVYSYQMQLEEKNRQLKEANEAMQKMFSIVAHDLRSPIAALGYSLTLLNDETITEEEFRGLTGRLNSDVGQLQYNLDNLLRWSLNQLQGIEARPKVVLVEEEIMNIIIFFQQMLMQKNIQVVTQFTAGVTVYTDPDHFALIMRNLLSNAVKYSYPGSIVTLRVLCAPPMARIIVMDRGTGMNEQVKQQLFSGSRKGSLQGTRNEKGTGLGLMLCKEFAEKNNSFIQVESTPGEGSVFTYSVPLAV